MRYGLSLGMLGVLAAAAPLHAGVEVIGEEPPVTTLIYGSITEGSDPIGLHPLGPVTSTFLLVNPDVAWRVDTAYPLAVWAAEGDSNDHDIFFSEWDSFGWGWLPPQKLTESPFEDLDPRVSVEPDGTVHVVWWRPFSQEVFWIERPAGQSSWGMAVRVNAQSESARRPSVVRANGELYIAYERDSILPGMMAQDVVIARLLLAGDFERQVVHSTARRDRLDVVVHEHGGLLWADWKHAVGVFGCAEHEAGQWVPQYVPWADPTWVGVEGARKLVASEVLAP